MFSHHLLLLMIWTMTAELAVTSTIRPYTRHQKRIHQIRSQQMLAVQQQHHHKSESHEDEDAEKTKSPGDPLGSKHTLEYGATCVKTNPQACEDFPEVTCVWVEENNFVCRCDFLHTWNVTAKLCVANIFAPCSDTDEEMDCGLNMECRPDIIGSNPNEKMCRCKEGYKVLIDKEGLPSRCIFDSKYFADDKEPNKMFPIMADHTSVLVSQNLQAQVTVSFLVQLVLNYAHS